MPGRFTLWYAFLGGPIAWSAHLLASYPLVPWSCELGTAAPLNVVTAVTALLAVGAAAAGRSALRRLGGAGGEARAEADEGASAGRWRAEAILRARFMAHTGLWLALLFTFVILVEGLPPILQDPCLAVG